MPKIAKPNPPIVPNYVVILRLVETAGDRITPLGHKQLRHLTDWLHLRATAAVPSTRESRLVLHSDFPRCRVVGASLARRLRAQTQEWPDVGHRALFNRILSRRRVTSEVYCRYLAAYFQTLPHELVVVVTHEPFFPELPEACAKLAGLTLRPAVSGAAVKRGCAYIIDRHTKETPFFDNCQE